MRIHAISLVPMSQTQKDRLRSLGELHYHDAVLGDPGVGELCRGAEIVVITPRLAIDIVPYLDGCRLISVQGAGVDALNVQAARAKGIAVTRVPDFCTDAVAEQAFALLFGVAKKLEAGPAMLREGKWNTALAFTTLGLRGKTLGLFGCGAIGTRIGEMARGLGLHVIATVREPSRPHHVPTVPFDELLARSDFIVLAAPATPQTKGKFGQTAFDGMKDGAILINVSRGTLIDHAALLDALDSGKLAGAGLDVFIKEPPGPDDPLLAHPKVLLSPHVAWGTEDAVQRLLDLSISNVEAFVAGNPVNLV